MVATPIGNLADITLRALHVLSLVDAVACEDTRVTGGLLRHWGLTKPLLSVHQHNEQAGAQGIVERLQQGQRVAYVSDAGTPAVSDPGAVLVAAVVAAGLRVFPLPGASSALTALSVAGDHHAKGFAFVGFLSTKANERMQTLRTLAENAATQVLFEAPHRIEQLLQQMAQVMPNQTVTVCRELTKQFEQVITLKAHALPAWFVLDANHGRGEFVVVLHSHIVVASRDALPAHAVRMLEILLKELPLKQAASLGAELSGVSRKALYQYALSLKADEAH